MAIRVKHSPSFDAVGGVALGVGQGQRARDNQQIALEENARRAALAQRQQELAAQQLANQQRLQAGMIQDELQRQHQLGGKVLDAQIQAARDQWLGDQRVQLAEQNADLKQQAWDWQFSAKQEHELSKLNNEEQAVRDAFSQGMINQQDAEKAIVQIGRRRGSIRPLPLPKPPEIDIQQEVSKRSFRDPVSGDTFWMQPDGQLEFRPGELGKQLVEREKGRNATRDFIVDVAEKLTLKTPDVMDDEGNVTQPGRQVLPDPAMVADFALRVDEAARLVEERRHQDDTRRQAERGQVDQQAQGQQQQANPAQDAWGQIQQIQAQFPDPKTMPPEVRQQLRVLAQQLQGQQ